MRKSLAVLTLLALGLSGCNLQSSSSNPSPSASVAIMAPQQDAVTSSRQVVVQVSSTALVEGVEVSYTGPAQGNLVLRPAGGRWQGELPSNLPLGRYTLKAKARLAGKEVFSREVAFTFDPNAQPPGVQVEWVTPRENQSLSGSYSVLLRVSDPSGIQRVLLLVQRGDSLFFLGSAEAAGGDYWRFNWNTTSVSNGEVTLLAVAENRNGIQRTGQIVVRVDNPDTQPPTVAWLDPLDGQNVAGTVTLSVRAQDNQAVDWVRFYAGGTLLGEVTAPPYQLNWDTTSFSDGPIVLKAIARDRAGNTSQEAQITVQVRNQGIPPRLDLLEPTDGAQVGLAFRVRASITRQGSDFTWTQTPELRVYDYRGRIVYGPAPLTPTPPDNQDSLAEALVDLGNLPADTYLLVVEGRVNVGGSEFRLYREARLQVQVASNLPPALVVYSPSREPQRDTILAGDFFAVVGQVTDDSGRVHAAEIRLLSGPCENLTGQNYLLGYLAAPYGYFYVSLPLSAHPYIPDGPYCLRVAAIDAQNQNLRSVQEYTIQVDRTRAANRPAATTIGAFGRDQNGNRVPVSTVSVPDSVEWEVAFSTQVRYTIFLRKGGAIQRAFFGTGSSFLYTQAFSNQDVGTWDLVAVFEPVGDPKVQGFAQSGSLAVTQPQ